MNFIVFCYNWHLIGKFFAVYVEENNKNTKNKRSLKGKLLSISMKNYFLHQNFKSSVKAHLTKIQFSLCLYIILLKWYKIKIANGI